MEVSREAIRQTAGETRHVKVIHMIVQVPSLPTHQVYPAPCPGGLARHNSNSIFFSFFSYARFPGTRQQLVLLTVLNNSTMLFSTRSDLQCYYISTVLCMGFPSARTTLNIYQILYISTNIRLTLFRRHNNKRIIFLYYYFNFSQTQHSKQITDFRLSLWDFYYFFSYQL